MYFITTKRMLEVCFFQHTPTFIIEPKKRATKPDLHQSATRSSTMISSSRQASHTPAPRTTAP